MSDFSTCTSLLTASLEAHQQMSGNLQSNLNIDAYSSIDILIYHTKNEIPMVDANAPNTVLALPYQHYRTSINYLYPENMQLIRNE